MFADWKSVSVKSLSSAHKYLSNDEHTIKRYIVKCDDKSNKFN